jgi:FkbM family methyltransferase
MTRRTASFSLMPRGDSSSPNLALLGGHAPTYKKSSRFLALSASPHASGRASYVLPGFLLMAMMVFVYGIGYAMRGLHLSRGVGLVGAGSLVEGIRLGGLGSMGSISSLGEAMELDSSMSSIFENDDGDSSYLMAVRERRIPMVVHLVVDPSRDEEVVATLKKRNPGWEIRTYPVGALDSYVEKWYREGSWLGLWDEWLNVKSAGSEQVVMNQEQNFDDGEPLEPRMESGDGDGKQLGGWNEARLNLFRYLVLAKFGGAVYDPPRGRDANGGFTKGFSSGEHGYRNGRNGKVSTPGPVVDADTIPIFAELIQPEDRFVAVWNVPYSSAKDAIGACHVRQRSLRHDVFAATANHPILAEVLGKMTTRHLEALMLSNENERTGEGLLTDTVVEYALHGEGDRSVRLLPVSALGVPGDGGDVGRASHHGNCAPENVGTSMDLALLERIAQQDAKHALLPVSMSLSPLPFVDGHYGSISHPITRAHPILYPKTPSFDVMVANDELSLSLMSHGAWQEADKKLHRPSLVELIIQSMGYMSADQTQGQGRSLDRRGGVLVDVGAGYGMASLAAASQGHRVVAFELRPTPLDALKKSIDRNGFDALISLREVPLGSTEQDGDIVCLRGPLIKDPNEQTGYGSETAKITASEAAFMRNVTVSTNCLVKSKRRAGHLVLGEEQIDALKVSANGWDGHVIEGFLPLLQPEEIHRPHLISFEWNLERFEHAGYSKPLKLIETLYSLGYRSVSHSGPICDKRWDSLSYTAKNQGNFEFDRLDRPAWCNLEFEDFRVLSSAALPASASTSEIILLLLAGDIK